MKLRLHIKQIRIEDVIEKLQVQPKDYFIFLLCVFGVFVVFMAAFGIMR